eukprot:3122988-Pleurochrysis_carterae.AAC.3
MRSRTESALRTVLRRFSVQVQAFVEECLFPRCGARLIARWCALPHGRADGTAPRDSWPRGRVAFDLALDRCACRARDAHRRRSPDV